MKRMFTNNKRIISGETMEPGQKSCNGKLKTRDGYCQSPGVTNFSRCTTHGGAATVTSLDLFSSAVGLEGAAKLQTLLDDTLNMDNELASGKTLLINALESFSYASYVIEEYMKNIPTRPIPGSDEVEIETYNAAASLHNTMLETAMNLKAESFKQSHALIRTLSTAVHRNNKIKEGNRFTLDAKQIASILKLQLETMAKHCKGCHKLREVSKSMRDGTKDIPLDPNISKQNREILGHRQYGKLVDEANDLAEKMYPE